MSSGSITITGSAMLALLYRNSRNHGSFPPPGSYSLQSVMILAATMLPESISCVDNAIARFRRGEPDALDAVIPEYQFRLYRFLLRLVQEPALAEDLFQQTWVRVIENASRYKAHYRFESWLFSIARNLAIDHFRRMRNVSIDAPDERGDAPVERMAAPDRDPLDSVLDFERGSILAAALGELPVIHREVLALRFEEGMSLGEIAEVAGIPLSTVKSRLQRALENLRERVGTRLSPGGRS